MSRESFAVTHRRRWRLRGRALTALLLLAITVLGGVLRFVSLDRPSVWGDEAATWYRVTGSFRELLNELDDTSFPPLHYELYWWINHGMPLWGEVKTLDAPATAIRSPAARLKEFIPAHPLMPDLRLTPFVMRFVPALAGTLMIPAVFFLTRQMFGPRVALLAATLTCFSAYLMVYARDAKMYSHFWLMCTLHVACLLWWLRARTLTAWLCWVACGIAMMGLQSLGGFILLVDVLIFLTAPRQHLLSLGRLAMLIGWAAVWPVVWMVHYFRRRRLYRQQAANAVDSNGPAGVERSASDASPRLARFHAWAGRVWQRFAFPPVLLFLPGLLLVATCTRPYYTQFISPNRSERVLRDDGMIDMHPNGTGWVEPYNRGRTTADLALYTTSAFLTGWEWPRDESNGVNDARWVDPRTLKLRKAAVVAILAVLAVGLVPWRKLFAVASARREHRRQDRPLPTSFVRRRLWWLVAWGLVPAYVMYGQSMTNLATPADGVAAVLLKAAPDVRWPRLPMLGKDDPHSYFSTATLRPFFEQSRAAWQSYFAAFTEGNFAVARCTILGGIFLLLAIAVVWRRRWMAGSTLRAVVVVIALFALLTLLSAVPRKTSGSTWMPRYVAVVMPAMLIGMAALAARLPGWPTRVAFLVLFAAANMVQFVGRTFGESEPRLDRIARDVIAAQPRSVVPSQPEVVTTRTYVQFPAAAFGGAPGVGTFESPRGAYYLWVYSGVPAIPRQILNRTYTSQFKIWRGSWPAEIERDLRRSKQIERFIVYSGLNANADDQTDAIGDRLAGRFRRVSDETMTAYDHWTWMQLYRLRRREYVKLPYADDPPATTTRPATRPAV